MSQTLYRKAESFTRGNFASRRENRDILRLLGGSRQGVAVQARKRRSFLGLVPPAPIHPAHEIPHDAGDVHTGQNSTGHDGPDRKHEEGTSPVNHRH
jgi:hypothetical protein